MAIARQAESVDLVVGAPTAPPRVTLRVYLRRWLPIEKGAFGGSLAAGLGLVGCSLLSSVLFFLVTNFAWWPWSNLYEHNWAGLVRSYENALPFFRHTLCGDLFFAAVLFGGYTLAVSLGWRSEPGPALEGQG